MGQTCSSACSTLLWIEDGHHQPSIEQQQQQDACELYYPKTNNNNNTNHASTTTTTTGTRSNKKNKKQLYPGQSHLLYKRSRPGPVEVVTSSTAPTSTSSTTNTRTRLVMRTRPPVPDEPMPGVSGTHIYAVRERSPEHNVTLLDQECAQHPGTETCVELTTTTSSSVQQEQRPTNPPTLSLPSVFPTSVQSCPAHMVDMEPSQLYSRQTLDTAQCDQVTDWVCVSPDLHIYICDTGLSFQDCNALVACTEHVCRGQYAAYTYAKQTLGCRDHPVLARTCFPPVVRVTRAIQERLLVAEEDSRVEVSSNVQLKKEVEEEEPAAAAVLKEEGDKLATDKPHITSTTTTTTLQHKLPKQLQLDDREPHIVKYDLSKKERQKLDMHTDKSEWTFLIALSDFCDYEEGGTFFEALDAAVHIQRGHALIFPGKLRHCGIKIKKGLRFLLVGFLVDKNAAPKKDPSATRTIGTTTTTTGKTQDMQSGDKENLANVAVMDQGDDSDAMA